MKPWKAITCALVGLAVSGPASAILVTYEYEFDTPTLDDPPFAATNAKLANAGPTISGTIRIDTDKIDNVANGLDVYRSTNGGFVHSGELDTVTFDINADEVRTLTGTTSLHDIRFWFNDFTIPNYHSISLVFDAQNPEFQAGCFDSGLNRCGGADFDFQSIPFADLNLRLTKTINGAPTPATAALLCFGIAGIGYQRSKKVSQ